MENLVQQFLHTQRRDSGDCGPFSALNPGAGIYTLVFMVYQFLALVEAVINGK
jgi:hypothetical protein